MKKTNKLLFCLLLTILLSALLAAGFAAAAEEPPAIVASGYCGGEGDGTNLTWTLDNEGTFTVSGTGKMQNYTFADQNQYSTTAPWYELGRNGKVKTVVIGDGVTNIGDCAFKSCYRLADVTIGNSVTVLGSNAFSSCSSLLSVTIPDSVTAICNNAFGGHYLLDVTVGRGVTSIAYDAFSNERYLHLRCYKNSAAHLFAQSHGIAYGLMDGTAEENTFSGTVENMTWTIDRLNCVMTVEGDGEMPYIPRVTKSWFPQQDEYVHTVIIRDGLTSISTLAFYGCRSITDVVIPNSVTQIGGGAFTYCVNLRNVTIGNGVTTIGEQAFFGCVCLESIVIPDSVTEIGDEAFNDCPYLSNVSLGNGVARIGDWAFHNCGEMIGIAIPDSVTSIGSDVFCANLVYIFYSDSEEQWNRIDFGSYNTAIFSAALHFNATDHTPAQKVTDIPIPPTCTEQGYAEEIVFCSQCGFEISRKPITLEPTGHVTLGVRLENETEATCTEEGGYDEVFYCVECDAELSRMYVATAATGHSWGEWEVIKQATTGETGLMRRVCANDPSHVEEEIIPKLQPQTNAFRQFIGRIRDFFNNILEWFRRLFRF